MTYALGKAWRVREDSQAEKGDIDVTVWERERTQWADEEDQH